MLIHCTFRRTRSSDTLTIHAQEQLQKLGKFAHKPLQTAHVVFEVGTEGRCTTHIVVTGADLKMLAQGEGDSFIQALDQAVHRLARQMERHSERQRSRQRRASGRGRRLRAA